MFRYDYRDQPAAQRHGRVGLSPAFFNEKTRPLELMTQWRAKPAPWAHDLLQVARAVYLVDKISTRRQGADRWSREIDLAIQVHEADRWQPVSDDLALLVGTLTGDRWCITIVGGANGGQDSLEYGEPHPPEEVALFSGGLDSTAYLASCASATGDAPNVLAVSHFHNHEKQAQIKVWHALQRLAPAGRLDRVSFRQLPYIRPEIRKLHRLDHEHTTGPAGCCSPRRPSTQRQRTAPHAWPSPKTVSSRSTRHSPPTGSAGVPLAPCIR
jgi:hypothetical protein